MKEKFFELFEYTFHFNNEVIQKIIQNQTLLPEKAFRLMNHILNAHQIWNARMLNEKTFGVWEMHLPEELLEINRSGYQKTKFILENTDLCQNVKYKNSKGDLFENKAEDILFHIINHSTYHRGQIMMLFRESEIEPIVSDYIFYKR